MRTAVWCPSIVPHFIATVLPLRLVRDCCGLELALHLAKVTRGLLKIVTSFSAFAYMIAELIEFGGFFAKQSLTASRKHHAMT